MIKFRGALAMAFLASTTSVVGAAHAAETSAASSADSSGGVEEVVVTAERREQNVQRVPIAISVISAKSAEQIGVRTTQDLATAVPGVTYNQSLSGATFYIRGVGQSDVNPGQELPVSIYVDGVYLATPTGGLFSLNNIERVEVLKGPQGTLFGRNATGGVIQVVTKDPEQTPSADISIGYANYDTLSGSLYGTTGIADNLAADIAIYAYNQGDGWGKNVFTNTPIYRSSEFNARTKWLWTPDAATTVTLAANYASVYADVGAADAIYPGSTAVGGYTSSGFYNINSEIARPHSDYKTWGLSLTADRDLSWAELKSISSFQNLNEHTTYDNDSTPVYLVDALRNYPAQTFTQELQLLSPSDSKIQWIAGFYYLNDRVALDPLTIKGPGLGAGPTFQLFRYGVQHTQSYAGYGEVTWPLFAGTNLITGARYTIDERQFHDQDINTLGSHIPPVNDTDKWSKPTWRAVLDHQFDPDVYGYIQYSTGFKSGQFNMIAPTSPPVLPETLSDYEAGLKTQLFNGRVTLNIAGYFYNYDNIQLTRVIIGGTQTFNAAAAQAKGIDVDSAIKVSDNFSLTGALSYFDGTYTSFPNAPGTVPKPGGGNATVSFDASGNSMIFAPKFQAAVGGVYTIPSDVGDFSLQGEYSYNSGYYFAVDNRVKQPAYSMVNASVEWTAPSKRWSLRFWGKNLANAKISTYFSEAAYGDFSGPAAPLTFGAELSMHFGE
jgi:iron complex outermembrane receptor protein